MLVVMVAIAMNRKKVQLCFQNASKIPFNRIGGAVRFALRRWVRTVHSALDNLGTGAVYFGWLGFLIGVVAIAAHQTPFLMRVDWS